MIFVTTVREIQCAWQAGLLLDGVDGDRPEYTGNTTQWNLYNKLMSEL